MRSLLLVFAVAACGSHHSGNNSDANGSGDGGGPPAPVVVQCPGCPTFPGLGGDAANTCSDMAEDPQLVYPPDQVLLPPNMNVIEVQFQPGTANTLFEIDFENAVTDVRLETMCTPITNTRGTATGGCAFDLDPTDWNYVSTANAGGDPVTVTVRGAPTDLSCVAGSNSRQISFASDQLMGGIYYWQSMTVNGVAGTTGGIFRKDFGNPDPTPEPFLTPTSGSNKCVGCHYLSRDGLKMTVGTDDADSDDELGDDTFYLYDVATRAPTQLNMAKGFAAWQGDMHGEFLCSDGAGKTTTPELLQFDGTSGTAGTTVSFASVAGLTGLRVTNPDWSSDGSAVYFTATNVITGITTATGCGPSGTMSCTYNNKDDIHGENGSLWQVPVTGNNTFGTPTEILAPGSATENDYYPAISPDGTSLVFDRATGTAGDIASLDSYNNPNATLYAMTVTPGVGTPVALAKANEHDALTNSWPRFSPFVQMYKGHRLLWVTFSSTRDYGLRVQNESPSFFNCYPPVTPEDPSGDHKKAFDPNCTQPQIWMAAIDLDQLAAGQDPSFPAFWLPFQDYTAHNHIAQWVDTIMTQSCQQIGQMCGTGCCDGLQCDTTSNTCVSVIQ
ncbi:MAG TPA: hypothetical protein VGF94_27125 [Kofleriaceae bacterium]|jgi:hypothetical protein